MNSTMPRVLCVDDEPKNLSLLEAILLPRGYDVVFATTGLEALEKIKTEQIDICLLDVMMPGMDGYEVCRCIKADDLYRNIPIVMITSYTDTAHRIQGIEAGAEDFISKPFDRFEVLARIKMLLNVKLLSDQLKSLNEHLEVRINEEVAKNREKDIVLLHADKMSSIGQLAAGVAHEINNPVAFIVSNLVTLKRYSESLGEFFTSVEQLVKTNGSDEVQHLFGELVVNLDIIAILDDIKPLITESSEGADRVKRIVRDLKNFARVGDSGFEWYDLNDCIQSTVNLVRNEIKYDSELSLQLGDIPQVSCSRHQISQVILNLLVNAAHSIKKQGSITVTTTQVGDYVLLSVGDNGCGMSKEVQKRIFEPFYTTKEVGKGTGLGLSISYGIIQKHHGEILVESEPGIGTTFTVKLPINSDKEQLPLLIQSIQNPTFQHTK